MIVNSTVKSDTRLYDIFNRLGITATEDHWIRKYRGGLGGTPHSEFQFSYNDIGGIGYRYPHIEMPEGVHRFYELWIGDSYLYPASIENVITTAGVDRLILDHDVEPGTIVIGYRNDGIIERYEHHRTDPGPHTYTVTLDASAYPWVDNPHPEYSCYAIADSVIRTPTSVRSGNVITFTCGYERDIEMILCDNLVGVFDAKANASLPLDNLWSNRCHCNIWVDREADYPVDSKFYPWIRVDKSSTVRVYNDRSLGVPCPEISRIVTYPEYIDVEDPYDGSVPYLNNLEPVDTELHPTDNDDALIEKFKSLVPYFYRAWEALANVGGNERNFIVCDNHRYGHTTFHRENVAFADGTTRSVIVSDVPFNQNRDVLWYNGMILDLYSTPRLRRIGDRLTETPDGALTYVFDSSLNPDLITLLKFNTAEDTVLVNVSSYVDEDNVLRLHRSLNRFYRNLLILRGQIKAFDDFGDRVRISRKPPNEKDELLWFELLTEESPEDFDIRPIDAIHKYNLDPSDMPESIRAGTLALAMDDAGPSAYTSIVETYFSLSDKYRDQLVLQLDDNESSRTESYDGIPFMNDFPENPNIGDIVLIPSDGSDVSGNLNLNMPFTMSLSTPGNPEDGAMWMDTVPEYDTSEYEDVVHGEMYEASAKLDEFPDNVEVGTLIFDTSETRRPDSAPEPDDKIYDITFGDEPTEPTVGTLWYEFLGEISDRVCYADTESMVIRVDERLLMVRFAHDNVTGFLFDDMLINFRGKLGIKYLGVLADLVNSGDIKPEDTNIFYRRLVTGKDKFDPRLRRLYTGTSYVVSAIESQPVDYSIGYSSNIGRFHVDYDGGFVTVEEREDLWRHIINHSARRVPFIDDRMILFVNGRLISRSMYERVDANRIHLIDFPEIIDCVDVLYSKGDHYLNLIRTLVTEYGPVIGDPEAEFNVIEHAERDYEKMKPLEKPEANKRGYYDVLIDEYIRNGKLVNILRDIANSDDSEGEFESFRDDLVEKFHAISDLDLVDHALTNDSRIIISGMSSAPVYTIE